MDTPASIRLVGIPPLRFLDYIRKHSRTTAEVVGVDAEEQSPTNEDNIAGSQIEFWVLGRGITFVRRWDVRVDERCVPGALDRCWGSG